MGETAVSTTSTGAAKSGPDSERPAAGGPTAEIDRLKFEILRSALYHDMRQTLLVRVHRVLTFLTILLGSGAVAAFGAAVPVAGQTAGVLVAVVGAAQLVWDFGGQARDHGDLRRRFYALLSEAETCHDIPDLSRRMVLLYADEPPVVARTSRRAHNQAGTSLFGDDFTRA